MSLTPTYDHNSEGQTLQIRRIANNSIVIIWIAGICCVLIFSVYFFILPAKAENTRIEGMLNVNSNTESLFTDKTALVNIGLKMQDIPETAQVRSMGNFRINKIIYEKKINKPAKPTMPDFSIKAVPK